MMENIRQKFNKVWQGVILGGFLVLLGVFLISVPVEAYTLSPDTGSVSVGSTAQIEVLAAPGDPGNDTAASVNLDLTGSGVIVTDVQLQGSFGIPECTNGEAFSDTEVCFSYGDSGGIQTGDVMGIIEVTGVAEGSVDMVADGTNTAYEPSATSVSGTLGTYSAISTGTGTLPETAIEVNDQFLIVSAGVVFLLIGLLSWRYRQQQLS